MPAAERVVIDIEVNSDIATIEATRRALEDLTDAQRRYNRERDREPRGGRGGRGGDDDDGGRGGRRGRGGGGGGRGGRPSRYAGFAGQVFDFRGDIGKAIGMYGALLKLVNKLAMVSLPLMFGALGLINLAFKAGTYFQKMYAAAMSTLATAAGIAFVAITTLLAAQREYAAVQNSPAYYEGASNTADRFVAAGQALSMFTDNTRLAVIGAKGLQGSFTTLSKVKPVTGQTVAAYTTLMDVVAGSGGDMEKSSQKLADFLAAVQKKGNLSAGSEAAKELGPDFEKIVKEAGALGIKTSDQFLKAAAEGKLGETFTEKYAGTLDALNNTVMGRFKSAVAAIKGQLTDLGGQYLGETGGAISRLQGIISKTISRLSYVLQDFDVSGKMGRFIDAVDKGADKFIFLMTKYLGTTPTLFEFFGNSFNNIGNAFDAMQDWMRQFQKAGELINKYFFKPLFNTIGESFSDSMKSLSSVIEGNAPLIESFAIQLGKTLAAIGKYGDTVRQLFIGAMPFFQLLLKAVEMFFKGLTAFGKAAIEIGDLFAKLGGLGKIAGAVVKVAALYALFTIATRFFRVLGMMFGKKMNKNMHVTAGAVYVNGAPMGGPMGAGGAGGPMGRPAGNAGMGFFRRTGNAFMGAGRGGAGLGGRLAAAGVAGGRQLGHYGSRAMTGARGLYNTMGGGAGVASMAAMMGGTYLSSKGDEMGGHSTAQGAAMKTAGLSAQVLGGAKMLGLGNKGMAPLAAATAAYGIGSYAASKFNDDSIKSRGSAALVGAAGGAAAGAAIGAAFAPFTMGLSVAATAAIGAFVGGAVALVKSGKQRKEIRANTKEFVEGYTEQVNEAMAGGNLEELLKARDDMMASRDKMIQESGDPAYQAEVFNKYADDLGKLNTAIDNVTQTVGIADRYFGISYEALNKIAKDKGILIEDKMRNFREVLELVADTAEDKARLIKQAWSNIGSFAVSEAMSYFDKKAQAKEQGKQLNATQERLRTGDTSTDTMDQYLKQTLDYNVSKFGDIGGLTNAFVGLEEQLATGSLKDLTEEQKNYMRNELKNAGATPEAILKNIDSAELATLLGGTPSANLAAYKNDDGSLNPQKIMSMISSKMKNDPTFLADLITASQSPFANVAGQQVDSLFRTGSGVLPPPSMSGMDASERRAANATASNTSNVPVANAPNNFIANTQITAAMLDNKTVDQIERVIAKALREQQERANVNSKLS